jgi:subtilisin-like proprotein convertase family protein
MKKTLILAAAGCLAVASVASAGIVNVNSTDVPKAIPVMGTSGDMDTSFLTVGDDNDCGGRGKIFDVNVALQYNHTFNGDLTVRVSGPDNGDGATTVELFSAIGGSSNDMDVEIDDQSENGPILGAVNDGSSRQPESGPALCAWNGGSAVGDWAMDIADNAGGDLGQLNAWSVTIDCQTKGKAPLCEGDDGKGGRGLGSWANNGRGNGDDLPPRGQRGR